MRGSDRNVTNAMKLVATIALFLVASLVIYGCNGDDVVLREPTVIVTPIPVATGSSEDPSGNNSTAPGLALTPAPGVRAHIEGATYLEAQGEIEAAAAAYLSVAVTDPGNRVRATLAAARLLLELDRPEDVLLLLSPFVIDATGEGLAAHYLLARANAALQRWQDSLNEYDAYIATGRPALPYAYLDRYIPLLQLGRPLDAIDSLRQGLVLGVPDARRPTFVLATAQAYESAGDSLTAIEQYRAFLAEGAAANDEAFVLARIISIKKELGDETYPEELSRLLGDYPGTDYAFAALTEALAANKSVPPSVRGLIFYRHGDYASAESAFREQVELAPDSMESAQAYFYVAVFDELRGDMESAVANYRRTPELNPASAIADDALWWGARILEDHGANDEAAALYDRLVDQYADSEWASDAAFRHGMMEYRNGAFLAAASTWQRGSVRVFEADRHRLALWEGKARLAGAKRTEAVPGLQSLASVNEDDYYGIRARALLADQGSEVLADLDSHSNLSPKFNWSKTEKWLTERTGDQAIGVSWTNESAWLRAQELWLVGRTFYGDAEFLHLLDEYDTDAVGLYGISRRLAVDGKIGDSARAGQRLVRTLGLNPNQGLPREILSLAYPAAFAPLVQRRADEAGVSPLLLLALVRQESFFEPRAASPAGALGLTQVLPSTAAEVALGIGVAGASSDRLLHADLNLRLGAHYLADRLEQFDNELFPSLASYNAGPTPVLRWRASAGLDADVFLETIEFRETRNYVQAVAENYAIYRYLYGGEREPSLPE